MEVNWSPCLRCLDKGIYVKVPKSAQKVPSKVLGTRLAEGDFGALNWKFV